jgi:hypothetical protein
MKPFGHLAPLWEFVILLVSSADIVVDGNQANSKKEVRRFVGLEVKLIC